MGEFYIGREAKVVGFEEPNAHDFEIGDIVVFEAVYDNMNGWYTFRNERGKTQELVECEFEWI